MNKSILTNSLNTLLLVAGRYVSVPAPLADKEGVGTSAEEYTFLWNTVLLFFPQFGRFLTVKESWKKKVHINNSHLIMVSKIPNPLTRASCLTSISALTNTSFSYVWWLAGLLVTLQTRYFRLIVPQWVTSTFRPVPNKKNWGYKMSHVEYLLNLFTTIQTQILNRKSVIQAMWY